MTFDELNINKPLLNALNDLELTKPTPIQRKAFSVIMSGKDVVGIAQTGTGKTFAYLLPCLRQWKFSKDKMPQILIIVPTRELVLQVVTATEQLTKYMNVDILGVYGGTNIKTQMGKIMEGVDILVATPGRLRDLKLSGILVLKAVKKLIIDEVDEMLKQGFRFQLTSIFEFLPQKRQNLMFSATMTEDVAQLIKEYFNFHQTIEAAPTGTPLSQIVQKGYRIPNFNTKVNLLKLLLENDKEMNKVLVFVATKKLADQLFEQIKNDFSEVIGIIHSNKSQNNRFKTVERFHNGDYKILIATDIVARGIDVSEVTHVINFGIPEVSETYIHRIGRTGRADKKGMSISFFTEKDALFQQGIEDLMNCKIPIENTPESLEISEVLTLDEMTIIKMKEVKVKTPKLPERGLAFHEKKEKNKKTRIKITRDQAMKKKYKKPKTRGQKK